MFGSIEHVIDPAELARHASDLAGREKAELPALLVDGEALIRLGHALQAAVLAEVERRGVLAEYGYGSTAAMLADTVNIIRREATKRVTRAHALHPSLEGSTEIPALVPRTQEAFAQGVIGVEQVDEIVKTMAELPAVVPAEVREETEKALVTLGRVSDAFAVRKAGRHALALADPDGSLPTDKELAAPERELYLQQRRDGRYGLTATLDTETGALLDTLLSPFTKPKPAEDGERDPRSPAQRRGDGFADLLQRVQRSVEMPTEAGERPTVVVTIDYHQLVGDLRAAATAGLLDHVAAQAVLNGEHPLTGEQARRIACDANLLPAVLGGPSETLDLGRAFRTASPAQRRMLNLRDKGCVKCGRPAKWCEAHHIKFWERDNGRTDIDNLCLLCPECHRLMHHSDWKVVMKPDGTPECIAPEWMPKRC
jgi:ferredoxin